MFTRKDFKVKRSPCRMSWQVWFNEQFMAAYGTRRAAEAGADEFWDILRAKQ